MSELQYEYVSNDGKHSDEDVAKFTAFTVISAIEKSLGHPWCDRAKGQRIYESMLYDLRKHNSMELTLKQFNETFG